MNEELVTVDEKVAYLATRQYGITGGGTGRMLFEQALREQPLDRLDALVKSARDEQERRRTERLKRKRTHA